METGFRRSPKRPDVEQRQEKEVYYQRRSITDADWRRDVIFLYYH